MKKTLYLLPIFLLVSLLSAKPCTICPEENSVYSFYSNETSTTYPLVKKTRPKNIILCIGDGMGSQQVAAARLTVLGASGKLHMEKLPIKGFLKTSSADNKVTDSAAAATALVTGNKTNNGMISILPDGNSITTILEAAQKKRKSTGLIATSSITHATPAAFGTPVKSRNNETEIARQLGIKKKSLMS